MELEEILQSPALAALGVMMLNESKARTQRKYAALNALAQPGGVVMAGDSIVEGFPLAEFFEEKLYNRGISGDTSGELLARLPETVLPLAPRLTLLWIGTNDLQDEVPTAQIAANLEAIGGLLEEQGSEVAVLSTAPVNVHSVDGNIRNTVGKRTNTAIEELNGRYQALCGKHGWTYIDVYSLLQAEGSLPESLSEDGLHPNIAGYIPVAKEITAFLSGAPWNKK